MIKFINKMFICVILSLCFCVNVNAISTVLSYNPNDGYLTINVDKQWFDDSSIEFNYAITDCYLKEHNNDSAYKKTLKFTTNTSKRIGAVNYIGGWETGEYICHISVNYSYWTDVSTGGGATSKQKFTKTNDEGNYSFQHRIFDNSINTETSTITGPNCNDSSSSSTAWSKNECTGHGYTWNSSKGCCNVIKKDNEVTGPSCGPGANSLVRTWTKEQCNDAHYDEWRSDWSSDENCCYLTKRATTQTGIGTSSGGNQSGEISSNSANDNYRIIFDQNYGYGLECESPMAVLSDGVCEGYVSPSTTVNFPSKASSMYREGQGMLLGWSKTPNCVSGSIVRDSSVVVDSNIEFYACYRENIGAYRYLQSNYLADGGTQTYNCGQKIYIEYCNKDNVAEYCYYYETSTGNYRQVYRNRLTNSSETALSTCEATQTDKGWMYATENGKDYSCGHALYITTCSDKMCNYTKISKNDKEYEVSGKIDESLIKANAEDTKKICDGQKKDEDGFDALKKCDNADKKNMTGTRTYSNFCYYEKDTKDDIYEEFNDIYFCKNGYIDKSSLYNLDDEKTCNKHGVCVNDYSVTCVSEKSIIPTLSVSSGLVGTNGKGNITVKAYANEGKIIEYYYSENYVVPTDSNSWTKVSNNTFTIETTPGIIYIWVKDSKGNISNGVSGAVLDTVNTNTTVKTLDLKDDKGNTYNPSRVSYETNNIKSSNYVKLSNELRNDSKVLADGFNPFDMEYRLEVESPTITVYATLTSTDSEYVKGYEPRTVNLNYGINTILIKIKNKEGIIRTYTILVTRNDDRTSDNTLSDISTDVGTINFNSNVTDYKIEIPSDTKNVNVNSTIASDKASYVSGYLPGSVEITGDTTIKLIKVKSETGSTRTYILTFVKEGTDYIEKESLRLSDLVIPGVNLPFESSVANYSVSVDYSVDTIDLKTTLNDKNSIITINSKKKNDVNYSLSSADGIGLDVGENFIEIMVKDNNGNTSYYRLTIIRKEFGLDVSNDATLKELNVLGHKINFQSNKKEYTVKIKTEKSLVITAIPKSNRAEVFIKGNNELTGFSTVRVKVVAENGEYETYSIDIKKDAFNKTIEIIAVIMGGVIILTGSFIIIMKKKYKDNKEYYEE